VIICHFSKEKRKYCPKFGEIFYVMQEDSYRHKGMRKNLIKTLAGKGISDRRVLEAMQRVPRHFFFDQAFLEHAYQDKAFPIGEGQTISQPYTVAFQTSLLDVKPNDRVLEVGTGSGYQCCILMEMGAKVYTIEYNKKLYRQAKTQLQSLGYKAHFHLGDGSEGWRTFAPYDKIIVTAGAPEVPHALVDQLGLGGILVIPVGDEESQQMVQIVKEKNGGVSKQKYDLFRFVPLVGKHGWKN
jgi:protein-L-isoaspartate(D-aspartate) O-methyltransferase